MENKTDIGDQNTQQTDQNPVSQPLSIPAVPKVNYFIIAGIILVCSALSAFGGYYLGKLSIKIQQNYLQPTPSPLLTPSSQPTSVLPTGWSYKNDACGVRFPIPPKEKPYYQPYDPNRQQSVTNEEGSGRFWDFPRGGSYPNMLSKFLTGNAEYKQASAMYASAEEASGYISSAVVVSCIANAGNLDNQSMLDTLKSKLLGFNQNTGEKGMEANKYTIQSAKEASILSKKVLNLTVSEYFENSGGQPFTNSVSYTILATSQYLYEVRVFGATGDSFVKETAQKIYDNLLFE